MLEKPTIADSAIITALQDSYGLAADRLDFLPLGADRYTAVYRAVTDTGAAYFVKLRGGDFDDMTIVVPRLLYDQGIRQVIPPRLTLSRQLWTAVDNFTLAVFPFIEGQDGYERPLSDRHWVEFGRALKAIHTAELDPAITGRIRREDYSGQWRKAVRHRLRQVETTAFADPISAELAALLRDRRETILRLVQRAERCATVLRAQPPPVVLCHGDMHAGNVLIDLHGQFYLVDWDTLILAPVERDLMFAGGGQFLDHRSPQAEERLFYQGYGAAQTQPAALAYYRCERIVQDIAAYCDEILLMDVGEADRTRGLRLLAGQFQPGAVVDITLQADTGR